MTSHTPHQWTEEPPVAECCPTFTLDRQIATARTEMGEERWQQLQDEWNAEPVL